jgi:uncharacterized membrane protein
MDLSRLVRHLACTRWTVRRAFPPATLDVIERAITEAESMHDGQIRFVVEGALDGPALLAGQSPRDRAIELFSQLRIWDTAANNGVLVYLLLADRAFEIVADRDIHADVGDAGWQAVCRDMESALKNGACGEAVMTGITGIAKHLSTSTGRRQSAPNELSDTPLVLP